MFNLEKWRIKIKQFLDGTETGGSTSSEEELLNELGPGAKGALASLIKNEFVFEVWDDTMNRKGYVYNIAKREEIEKIIAPLMEEDSNAARP